VSCARDVGNLGDKRPNRALAKRTSHGDAVAPVEHVAGAAAPVELDGVHPKIMIMGRAAARRNGGRAASSPGGGTGTLRVGWRVACTRERVEREPLVGGFCRTVLIVADHADAAAAAVIGRIADELSAGGHDLIRATTARDGVAQVQANLAIGCLLLDWDLGRTSAGRPGALALIAEVRRRSADLPIFLLASRTVTEDLPLEVSREIQEYVWLFEDTPAFIAGRVSFAVRRYEQGLLPPFFRALVAFSDEHEYSWHTPGHAGGAGFLKTPVGRVFHDFFGEQVFRSDLSVSVGELGSLLDHSGPAGAAEANAARIFGADMTYFVLNGTSAAVMVVPYPPGIPLLMPGEQAGPHDGPVLGYLRALQELDRKFPGFSHDIHGVEPQADGTYRVMCVKNAAVGQALTLAGRWIRSGEEPEPHG
jgi:hypothetical protein